MKIQPSPAPGFRLRVIMAFCTVIALAVTGAAVDSTNRMLVIGHRGAAGLAPENTLAGFKRAIEVGVDAVEMDLHLSADGQLIVYHDYRLSPNLVRGPEGRWVSDRGVIKTLTLAELKNYDVGRLNPKSRYSRRFPEQQSVDGQRIPTLKEVLTMVAALPEGRRPQLWLEIKTSPQSPELSSRPEAMASAVIELISKHEFQLQVRILSFDWRVLYLVRKLAPQLTTVHLSRTGGRFNNIQAGSRGISPWTAPLDVDEFDGSIPGLIAAAGGCCWAPHYREVHRADIVEAHRLNLKVYVWTVDDIGEMERLGDMGVDGIITNRPDILKEYLRKKMGLYSKNHETGRKLPAASNNE